MVTSGQPEAVHTVYTVRTYAIQAGHVHGEGGELLQVQLQHQVCGQIFSTKKTRLTNNTN